VLKLELEIAMSKSLELPDPVYDALEQAASDCGTTPVGWIASKLPPTTTGKPGGEHKSLADTLAGLIGSVHSGGKEALSQNCGERFTDYLIQKKREGRL
jgi:hypothetical protein